VKRVDKPLEELFKYLSDESSSEDEEWTEGPITKKDDPTASKGKLKFSECHVHLFSKKKTVQGIALKLLKCLEFRNIVASLL
jgi:hypothetical protein